MKRLVRVIHRWPASAAGAFGDLRERLTRRERKMNQSDTVEAMLELFRRQGVRDERVLAVMASIPRERFVPVETQEQAYADTPLAIGLGQTISQPLIVALMSEAVRLGGSERVLEIGAGSGYQTAILAELAAAVVAVERHRELAWRARAVLTDLGYENVEIHVDDGSLGWPEGAPYDAILVAAAAPHPPGSLLAQLAEGGRLVVPVGPPDQQQLLRLTRRGADYTTEDLGPCRFVPLVGAEGWPANE